MEPIIIQGLITYLAVHLDQIISFPLSDYLVEAELTMSVNVKHTLKSVVQDTVIISKLWELFAEVSKKNSSYHEHN